MVEFVTEAVMSIGHGVAEYTELSMSGGMDTKLDTRSCRTVMELMAMRRFRLAVA